MDSKSVVLEVMRQAGLLVAQKLQEASSEMTGDELYYSEELIPDFQAARSVKNMLNRKAGDKDGFVCKSSAGRIVRLIQPYDSDTYTAEPEELPAQWRFVWPKDPKKALPFVAIGTSPYNTGECCTYEGRVYRSGQDGNVFAPGSVGVKWEDLGTIEEVLG